MDFLISNWFLIVIAIAAIVVGGYSGYVFAKRPTTEQIIKVKEWLLYAVTEAEKVLGSGTGQVKLRYVYDMFLTKFPYLSKAISFESFSVLVDEVLVKFRELLSSNDKLKDYVEGE
jgi:hypothetical protein